MGYQNWLCNTKQDQRTLVCRKNLQENISHISGNLRFSYMHAEDWRKLTCAKGLFNIRSGDIFHEKKIGSLTRLKEAKKMPSTLLA